MFIDGLDEFEGQEDAVIKMIDDLADQTHVKVCVSSRPLIAFEEAFVGKPSLRLQDLTFDSMIEYGKVKLSEPIQKYVSLNMCEPYQAEVLLDNIVERAHGVFLWAIIAIRDIHAGLRGMADINELVQSLKTLPSEIESLFMFMLHRIKSVFKRDAAYFLQIAIYQDSSDRDHMDLCRLHFCHSQRELKDRPAHYEDIATNELVKACQTLKTRLLSHTAGLLELTPKDKGQRIYKNKNDHDPILFMTINFLHRTARDFLLQNDEAKSFLASYGCSEAQIRLSIARGTLAQVAHLSQGDPKCVHVEDHQVNPVYYPFLASLVQISKTEQILCAAQTKLMQSLNYESLAWGYYVPRTSNSKISFEAFMIDGGCLNSIDQVGMAAHVGMTRYVCEQLDLPVESQSYPSSFPDLSNDSRSIRTTATLAWSKLTESQSPDIDIAVELRSSRYRQALGRCLQWKSDDQLGSKANISENSSLVETYMLCCCDGSCLDLAWTLLRAGANPMGEVNRVGGSMDGEGSYWTQPFWDKWLHCMTQLRRSSMTADGGFQRLQPYYHDIEKNITSKSAFNFTKALLTNGTDINHQSHYHSLSDDPPDFKRQISITGRFEFSLAVSAIFILEECFSSEPEFRHFASEIDSLVKRPTRKIVTIDPSYGFDTVPHMNDEERWVDPSAEEAEMLWPFFEKWEDTGRRDDLDALDAAFEEVWRAHYPGVELRERSDWSSDNESTTNDEDDDEDDDMEDDDVEDDDVEDDDYEMDSGDSYD